MERQSYDIYIASCDKEGGIYQYRCSREGELKFVSYTRMDRPMYMIVQDHKMHILLREPFGNEKSGLITYEINDQGSLEHPTEIISTRGKGACHLAKVGADLYCVNYWSGSVVRMPDVIRDHNNWDLYAQEMEEWRRGKQVIEAGQKAAAHTHFIGETPDGQYLLVTDLGLDKVVIYDKELTIHSAVDLPLGSGPRHLACHENGTTIFCANELQSTVSVLAYEDGRLQLLDTVSALPADFQGQSAAAAIRCRKNKVYVSNRGHDSIAVFDFSEKGLVLEQTVSAYGKGPRDFWETEEVFFCANEKSDHVTMVSKEDGRLLCSLKMKAPICVCSS